MSTPSISSTVCKEVEETKKESTPSVMDRLFMNVKLHYSITDERLARLTEEDRSSLLAYARDHEGELPICLNQQCGGFYVSKAAADLFILFFWERRYSRRI